MGAHAGPDINEDGLVLALDAGNAKSYPGSGNTWSDLSGNGNNFTLSGVDYNTSPNRFTFIDNQGDYILRSTTDVIGGLNQISCEMWMRVNTLTGAMAIFSYATTANNNELLVFKTTTNLLELWFGSSFVQLAVSDSNWNTGNYIQFVFTRNGTNMKFYYDGSFVAETNSYFSGNIATGGTLAFGQEQDSPGGSFDVNQDFVGDISAIKIYNRALTENEVKQNFNATRSRFGI